MPRENFTKINEEYFYTILDEDFSFKGIIKFKDSSIIKGYIKGIIESQSDLIIGPNAVIDADISAKALECFGRINGNVTVEGETYFHAPAVLNGDLKTSLLTFEKGCAINGNVNMRKKNKDNKTVSDKL
ncbi:MAG: polymer-forming cytoskeletal protein [Spirochaetes bacterium]|nr:polymer-forming cytoskeletal protein [Spirochaetota bacterium]